MCKLIQVISESSYNDPDDSCGKLFERFEWLHCVDYQLESAFALIGETTCETEFEDDRAEAFGADAALWHIIMRVSRFGLR